MEKKIRKDFIIEIVSDRSTRNDNNRIKWKSDRNEWMAIYDK